MTRTEQDRDPTSRENREDQIAPYDALRRRCPVAWSDAMQRSFLTHADVSRAILDQETFSNGVSARPSVPNGMDPPDHTPFRALIEPYFGP